VFVTRRRRGCGKVGIPPLLRDFQAEWETCFWFSTQRLFHSLPTTLRFFQQRPALYVIASDDMQSVSDGQRVIEMFVHEDSATRQTAAPARRFDLQPAVAELNGVVAGYGARLLDGKDEIQIPAPTGHEGMAWLKGGDAETPVEIGDVFLAQELVGSLWRGDPAQAQLLREPALPSAEVPLRATPGLRGVGRNHLNAQLLQCSAHLREPLRIDLSARPGRFEEMAGAIAVKGTERPLLLDHFAQRRHHRAGRFLLDQWGVIDLAVGIVEHDQQVVPAIVLKPAMVPLENLEISEWMGVIFVS
jgi:hypothetical protein